MRTWRQRVIPVLFRWAGIQKNPFHFNDKDVLHALEVIIDVFYGDVLDGPLTTSHAAFRIVSILI